MSIAIKRFALFAIVAMVVMGGIGAQDLAEDDPFYTDAYVRTWPVQRIYPHNLGYMVVYRSNSGASRITYVPMEWFRAAASKAEMYSLYDSAGPRMEVHWSGSDFSHVRLYVPPTYLDPIWGSWPRFNPDDPADDFINPWKVFNPNAESLDLQF